MFAIKVLFALDWLLLSVLQSTFPKIIFILYEGFIDAYEIKSE